MLCNHFRLAACRSPCSLGLSATSQEYFSFRTNQQPASSTFLSKQTSTSHQPPAKRTDWILPAWTWIAWCREELIQVGSSKSGSLSGTQNAIMLFKKKSELLQLLRSLRARWVRFSCTQRHGLQNTTLTSPSIKIFIEILYIYFYKNDFQNKSIDMIFAFLNSTI
jgi:hypothetical protein